MSCETGEKIPTDPVEMDNFAEAYNNYVNDLYKNKIINLKMWEKVKKEWKRITS